MNEHADWRVLENVRLAAGCGAGPAMLLSVALATASPRSVRDALDFLGRLGPLIEDTVRTTSAPHAALAELEPELLREPELAKLRLDIGDHELRGRLLFGELLGKRTFFQVAALAIAGVELSARDSELLEHDGVLTQLADPRIWPLAVVRRIAAGGGTLAEAVVGGVASLCTPQMTGLPSAGFMRFLDQVEAEQAGGSTLESLLGRTLSNGERVAGIGRPVLGRDERVAPMLRLAARYGRAAGPSMRLARRVDAVVKRIKGLRVNSAGYHGALLRDLGFSPAAAAAFCLLYFIVPVLAHAVFLDEPAR